MTTPQPIDDNTPDKLDILIDQVGRFTEGLTDMRLVVTEGFTELKQMIHEQAEVARQQALSIDRLADTVRYQAETANRLITLLEKQQQSN